MERPDEGIVRMKCPVGVEETGFPEQSDGRILFAGVEIADDENRIRRRPLPDGVDEGLHAAVPRRLRFVIEVQIVNIKRSTVDLILKPGPRADPCDPVSPTDGSGQQGSI